MIGAGFVGVEVASSALALGATVTVGRGAAAAVGYHPRCARRRAHRGARLPPRSRSPARRAGSRGRRRRPSRSRRRTGRWDAHRVRRACSSQSARSQTPNSCGDKPSLRPMAESPTDGLGWTSTRTSSPAATSRACGARRRAASAPRALDRGGGHGTGRCASAILAEEAAQMARAVLPGADHFRLARTTVGHPTPDDAVAIDGDGDELRSRVTEDLDGNVEAALAPNRPGELAGTASLKWRRRRAWRARATLTPTGCGRDADLPAASRTGAVIHTPRGRPYWRCDPGTSRTGKEAPPQAAPNPGGRSAPGKRPERSGPSAVPGLGGRRLYGRCAARYRAAGGERARDAVATVTAPAAPGTSPAPTAGAVGPRRRPCAVASVKNRVRGPVSRRHARTPINLRTENDADTSSIEPPRRLRGRSTAAGRARRRGRQGARPGPAPPCRRPARGRGD